jgi:hypothetical protein
MKLVGLILIGCVAGCGSMDNFLANYQPLCPGTTYYDPQVCRGEKFQSLPPFINEAKKRRERGEYW